LQAKRKPENQSKRKLDNQGKRKLESQARRSPRVTSHIPESVRKHERV
jgi:hypothetical protein